MDKNQINQIAENLSDAEQVPDVVFQLTEDCKSLLSEVERLEARHKADQKAVEEANIIAENYRKKLNTTRGKLFDAKNEIGFFETSYEIIRKACIDLQDKNAQLEKELEGKEADLKTIPTMVLVNELASREGVFQEFVVDHGSRRISVYGPANILIVNK